MKKTLLILIAAVTITAANAQTYVGEVKKNLTFTQVDDAEFVYWASENDSLFIYNLDLTLNSKYDLDSKAGYEGKVWIVSKKLFDSDGGFEFLVSEDSTVSWVKTNDVKVYDNGSYTSLPNLNLTRYVGYIDVKNTDMGADIMVHTSDVVNNEYVPRTIIYHVPGKSLLVKELDLDEEVSMYPNPTVDMINIKGKNGEPVRILDVNGAIVKETRLNGLETQVNVSELSNGVYLVQTASGTTWKFVKQ